MPRPGFYNDNEYRAYPFIYTAAGATTLPNSVVVDAGFVMGLDAGFNAAAHSVWLASIQRAGNVITLTFATDAAAAPPTLQFTRNVTADTWQTEFVEVAAQPATAPCQGEPIWEGFLTTGALAQYAATLGANQTITFVKNQHQIEPARVQNLAKSYLRSISVGNFARTTIPACGTVNSTQRPIVQHTACIKGDVRFKEGYNCQIIQTDRAKDITITAVKGAGLGSTGAELCEYGSELPLFSGEVPAANAKFFSGGPACDDLIATINGLGGRSVNIVGGTGVKISTSANKITVRRNENSQNNCSSDTAP